MDNPEVNRHKSLNDLIGDIARHGGGLFSSNDFTITEIADAAVDGLFAVEPDGTGYVRVQQDDGVTKIKKTIQESIDILKGTRQKEVEGDSALSELLVEGERAMMWMKNKEGTITFALDILEQGYPIMNTDILGEGFFIMKLDNPIDFGSIYALFREIEGAENHDQGFEILEVDDLSCFFRFDREDLLSTGWEQHPSAKSIHTAFKAIGGAMYIKSMTLLERGENGIRE